MTATPPGLLIRDVEIDGRPGLDCRIHADRISGIGRGLAARSAETVIDGRGGALLPGLADHHIHLAAWAAWRDSLDLTDIEPRQAGDLVRSAAPGTDGWIRVVGYDDAAHGPLDRDRLDTWNPAHPVRVQHRSGALWVINSAGLARLSAANATHPGIERTAAGELTGRCWRADNWLRDRLGGSRPSLRAVGRELASFGITHLADATPDDTGSVAALLAESVASGDIPQHVLTMSTVGVPAEHPRLAAGPVKLVVADHEPPDLDDLVDRMRAAHAANRPVAVHCVTRHALALTLAGLDTAGVRDGDRIEHCAVIDPVTAHSLAERALRVVTQPTLLTRRGDSYWEHSDPADRPDLWRYGGLLAAGVRVAPSSDAPYGDPDPWVCLRAAAERRTRSGRVLDAAECVVAQTVLDGLLSDPADPGGPPRRVRRHGPADLVLLDRALAVALRHPDARYVRATIIGGSLAYTTGNLTELSR